MSVVSLALPMACSRSIGQPSAAKRREPVIVVLNIVRGAYSESAEVSFFRPERERLDQRAGEPRRICGDAERRTHRLEGYGGQVAALPRHRSFSDFLPDACAAHIGGMSRLSGSVVITLCISRIAEMPSTREWCSLV